MMKAKIFYDDLDRQWGVYTTGIAAYNPCGFGKTPEEALFDLNRQVFSLNPLDWKDIEVDKDCKNLSKTAKNLEGFPLLKRLLVE
jgi:hypothetical protein